MVDADDVIGCVLENSQVVFNRNTASIGGCMACRLMCTGAPSYMP